MMMLCGTCAVPAVAQSLETGETWCKTCLLDLIDNEGPDFVSNVQLDAEIANEVMDYAGWNEIA